MTKKFAYSVKQTKLAINLSAILGWAAVALPICFSNPSLLIPSAILGLPIAFVASWVVAAPVMKRLMKNSVSWFAAARWGGTIAFYIALISIFLGRIRGCQQRNDQTSFSQYGGGDYVREIDGVLTNYGWLYLGQSTLIFVFIGVCIALVLRLIIGPGNVDRDTDKD